MKDGTNGQRNFVKMTDYEILKDLDLINGRN